MTKTSAVFARNLKTLNFSPFIHLDHKMNGSAANLAILDKILGSDRTINRYLNALATIRTGDSPHLLQFNFHTPQDSRTHQKIQPLRAKKSKAAANDSKSKQHLPPAHSQRQYEHLRIRSLDTNQSAKSGQSSLDCDS